MRICTEFGLILTHNQSTLIRVCTDVFFFLSIRSKSAYYVFIGYFDICSFEVDFTGHFNTGGTRVIFNKFWG